MERPGALVIDAGPLYAYVDRASRPHEACLALFRSFPGPLIVPELTIAEVVHFIGKRLSTDAELRFLADLGFGNFIVEPVHPADWLSIADLVRRYRELRLGTVDASVVVAAERLRARTIATLDRRHFSVVRPRHVDAFELVP